MSRIRNVYIVCPCCNSSDVRAEVDEDGDGRFDVVDMESGCGCRDWVQGKEIDALDEYDEDVADRVASKL